MHPYQPVSGREFPRFSGLKTFFRLPYFDHPPSDIDVCIMGIPFDGGVSYRPGARFGPQSVREASSLGRGYHWSRDLTIFDKLKSCDIGDCSTVPIDLNQTYQKISKRVLEVASQGKRLISVGGDHSTTLPVLRSLCKVHGPLHLVHFDAHLDTYPAAWDCEYHHGSFLRHAILEGLVKSVIQFGIRGPLASKDDLEFVKTHNIKVFTVDDIRIHPTVFDFVKSKEFLAATSLLDGPSYISFDVDALDPSQTPGTGTPVVGGITTHEAQVLLRHLKLPKLIGGDIVEISPPYDLSSLTALVGVDVMFEYLCLMREGL